MCFANLGQLSNWCSRAMTNCASAHESLALRISESVTLFRSLVSGVAKIVHCSLSVVGCPWSVVPCRSQAKFPNPKPQAPKKSQAANPKRRLATAMLELGTWSFFGIWSFRSHPSASTPSMFSVRCWMFDVRLFITDLPSALRDVVGKHAVQAHCRQEQCHTRKARHQSDREPSLSDR